MALKTQEVTSRGKINRDVMVDVIKNFSRLDPNSRVMDKNYFAKKYGLSEGSVAMLLVKLRSSGFDIPKMNGKGFWKETIEDLKREYAELLVEAKRGK